MSKTEETFAQLIDELRPRIEKLCVMMGDKRFSYKTAGWQMSALEEELKRLELTVNARKDQIKELDVEMENKRKEGYTITLRLRQETKELRDKMLVDYQFVHENREMIEKRIYNQVKQVAAA